jgi:hypothetical protein
MCVECNVSNGNNRSTINIVLCDTCVNLDKYTLITKTNAKKEYLLNDSDLEDLRFVRGKTKFCIATFYYKSDLMDKASVKFNTTPDNIDHFITNIITEKNRIKNERKQKRLSREQIKQDKINLERNTRKENLINALQNTLQNTLPNTLPNNTIEFDNNCKYSKEYINEGRILNIYSNNSDDYITNVYDVVIFIKNEKQRQITLENERNERKQQVNNALQEAGLELRSDSKLCQKYIDGEPINLDDVVKRMCQMRYLYEHCNMNECRNIAYNKYKKSQYNEYDRYDDDQCNNDYDEKPQYTVSDMAEKIALQKYSNGKYPDIFPWQN